MKLSNLNNYYQTKLKTSELSKLKLSDTIIIKNKLKEKILKEIQGIRTSPNQYQELDKVNQIDIQIIMKDIKLSLGL